MVVNKKDNFQNEKIEKKKKTKNKEKQNITSAQKKKLDKQIEQLQGENEKLREDLSELKEKFLRVAAEFENYKKRRDREIENIINQANKGLFIDLLPIIDDFERSLNTDIKKKSYQSLMDGVKLIYQKFLSVLKKKGLEPIEALDHPFNPELHEALLQVDVKDKESNIVVEEAQKGYRLKDKVLRHSKVIVNK